MVYVQIVVFPILTLVAIGTGLSGARRRLWWAGVVPALIVFGLVMLGHRVIQWRFVAPISWAVDADWSPFLMTAAIGVLFATLIPKLPQRRTRIWVWVLAGVMLVYYGLLPAVMPLWEQKWLTPHDNLVDRHGICRQRYAFTCGPAAAVTCLGRLGIVDNEVEIAVEARSSMMFGTDGELLAKALTRRHPGVEWRYRYVGTLEEVRPPATADMMMPRIGGHYVAVLAIRGDTIVIGDPMDGLQTVMREAFLAQWQHGVVEIKGQ